MNCKGKKKNELINFKKNSKWMAFTGFSVTSCNGRQKKQRNNIKILISKVSSFIVMKYIKILSCSQTVRTSLENIFLKKGKAVGMKYGWQ